MSEKILYENKILNLDNLKLDDKCEKMMKAKVSLGDFIEQEISRFNIFIDLLGLHYIDLAYFRNNFYGIKDDMKILYKVLPINLRLLYLLLIKEIENCCKYLDSEDRIKQFLEKKNVVYI